MGVRQNEFRVKAHLLGKNLRMVAGFTSHEEGRKRVEFEECRLLAEPLKCWLASCPADFGAMARFGYWTLLRHFSRI